MGFMDDLLREVQGLGGSGGTTPKSSPNKARENLSNLADQAQKGVPQSNWGPDKLINNADISSRISDYWNRAKQIQPGDPTAAMYALSEGPRQPGSPLSLDPGVVGSNRYAEGANMVRTYGLDTTSKNPLTLAARGLASVPIGGLAAANEITKLPGLKDIRNQFATGPLKDFRVDEKTSAPSAMNAYYAMLGALTGGLE